MMDAEGDAARQPAAPGTAPRLLATLCFSAENDFLTLVRSTATHVAGLLGLPFGQANDLRLAVDEACTLFLAGGGANDTVGDLVLVFAEVDGDLRVTVSGPTPLARPDLDGLSWTLLCALVGEPRWEVEEDVGILTLNEAIPVPS